MEGKPTVVLITGPTASRKSTLVNWLMEIGENVIDADKLTASWHKNGKPHSITEEEIREPAKFGLEWAWNEKKLLDAISRKRERTLYVIGTASNTFSMAAKPGLFDVLICLKGTREELEQSMAQRPARHPEKKHHYGRTEEQRNEVLESLPDYYRKAERAGFRFIDFKMPEPDKLAAIQKIIGEKTTNGRLKA